MRFKKNSKISCLGCKSELVQVLVIILNNAQEALKETKKPKVEILSKYENEKIHILIKNNGIPIKDDYLDKVFDPYFTTKHRTLGAGLGLYISKMIITQKFDGFIRVCNKQGTIFELVLDART